MVFKTNHLLEAVTHHQHIHSNVRTATLVSSYHAVHAGNLTGMIAVIKVLVGHSPVDIAQRVIIVAC